MGWDAYAYRSVEDHLFNLDNHDPKPHLDVGMQQVFEEATAELVRQTGSGGACLCVGELGGSWSKKCLSLATPISCDTAENERGVLCWPPEVVRQANALADWNFPIEEIDGDPMDMVDLFTCVKDDARFFLQTCAQHGYAIVFTG